MSLTHFFLDSQSLKQSIDDTNNNSEVVSVLLDKSDYKHFKALRIMPGEFIGVIDCESNFWFCEVVKVNDDSSITVHPTFKNYNKEHKFVTLFSGISKSNKMDEVIRACTEIGVYSFHPVIFERTIVKLDDKKAKNKCQRWKKIAKSAAMQSCQYRIPKIHSVQQLNDISLNKYDAVYVFWEDSDEPLSLSKHDNNIAIFIGPEGGISVEEIEVLKSKNKNTKVMSLGSSILRTQTANIVASALVLDKLS